MKLAGTKKKQKQIFLESNEDVTEAFIEGTGFAAVYTGSSSHIGTRNYQEDSFFVTDASLSSENGAIKAFGIVCDGMGGLENGSLASRLATDMLKDVLEKVHTEENIEAIFKNVIYEIDFRVKEECTNEGGAGGTTLVAAIILGKHLHWVGVGDSRVYVLRGKEIVQVTQDHIFKMQLLENVDRGLIPQEVADEHPQRNALISYVGSGDIKYINTNKAGLDLIHGDVVLLCSDGLTKSLSDERISGIVQEYYGGMKEAAQQLTLQSFDSGDGAKDNTTVVLMQFFE